MSFRAGRGVSVDFRMYLLFTCNIELIHQFICGLMQETSWSFVDLTYLFQFDIVFAAPNRIDEGKFNQTAENEETAAEEPHFGYFDVTDFR